MHREYFSPSVEGEARILILVDSFSKGSGCLEGRTKLAKLDFLLRYPKYFKKALKFRSLDITISEKDVNLVIENDIENIENQMIRYRYGPWDPAYYGILGRLIGKGLIEPVSITRGIGFKTTNKGKELAKLISDDINWHATSIYSRLLKKYFDLSGTKLKEFVYKNFPEVTQAKWGERL